MSTKEFNPDDYQSLAHWVDDHCYLVVYSHERRGEVREAFRDFASNEELNLQGWQAELLGKIAEDFGDNQCATCGASIGLCRYTHTKACECRFGEPCRHPLCERCFGALELDNFKFWSGTVRCGHCGHYRTCVISIPPWVDEPCVPMECANCGLFGVLPE